MNTSEQKELEEIEVLASEVYGMISLTKDSCRMNEYNNEEAVLQHALNVQNQILEKLINITMRVIP